MPDTFRSIASDLSRDLVIREVTSTIVDVPTVRKHKLSSTSVTAQNYVIVRVRLANGAEGIGEAATLGGPRWSEESVEAMKANIDAYLAPAIMGQRADRFEAAGVRMDQAAKRNNAAKAAVETALFDAVGKTLGLAGVRAARRRGAGPHPGALDARLRRPGAGGGGGASASSRRACTAPSRSRSARRRPRPTWPACATSPARWRDGPS